MASNSGTTREDRFRLALPVQLCELGELDRKSKSNTKTSPEGEAWLGVT